MHFGLADCAIASDQKQLLASLSTQSDLQKFMSQYFAKSNFIQKPFERLSHNENTSKVQRLILNVHTRGSVCSFSFFCFRAC